jgi:transcriptional regulator with XRE-family HTH domain
VWRLIELRKKPARELGSKYLGRSLREFRLSVGLSQEELAHRASVSVSIVGNVEREATRLSEQTLCKLCFALEEAAERPLLKDVFESAMVTFWSELRSVATQLQKDRGLALPESLQPEPSLEEAFGQFLEEYVAAERALLTFGFRFASGETLNREGPPVPKPVPGRVRARRQPPA